MTTLRTTIKLALLIQYPDKHNQRRVKLVKFDDYWLLFALYFVAEIVSQVRDLICVWRARHAEAVKMLFFGWVVFPYGPG